MPVSNEQIESACKLISGSNSIVAFTGAGISTESGLTDFRSPGGLWTRHRMVTYPEFLDSEEARTEYWAMHRELIPSLMDAQPNPAHVALAELERQGRLTAIITQNIDGLHQDAGSSRVIELHGSCRTATCLSCAKEWRIEDVQLLLDSGNLDPHCDICDGQIKPETISFGQDMPTDALDEAFQLAKDSDLLLMIGSSLEVQPAASIPLFASQAGARLLFINKTETSYDGLAKLLVRCSAGQFLARAMEEMKSYSC